jgi:hypothetical protein
MLDDHFGAGETEPIPAILAKGGNAILILAPYGVQRPTPSAKRSR